MFQSPFIRFGIYVLALVLLVSCMDNRPDLTGTWQFIADQEIDNNGNIIREDTDVDGILIYTPDGDMSVQLLWRGQRRPIMHDSIMQRDGISSGLGIGTNTWSSDERGKLIDTFDSYFGEYKADIESGIVTHIVEGNMRPEKTPVEFKRKFFLKGDTLLLRSADPEYHWQAAWLRKK
jgi:hypothetical protein